MVPSIFAHGRGRRRDDRQIQTRHEDNILPAESPCVISFAACPERSRGAGHFANPPAIAVLAAADTRAPAWLERLLDKILRENLPAAYLSVVPIQLAKCEHLPRRH